MIEVVNLSKSFGDNHVLKDITTTIKKGEKVVVIGPSGSGKSTFLRCLNCMEDPTGGSIIFGGEDIADPKVDINIHRQKMGMVFQHFNLFNNKTVIENIMMAPVYVATKKLKKQKRDNFLIKLHLKKGTVIPIDGSVQEIKKQAQEVVRRYPHDGFPTVYLLGPDGKVLDKKVGFADESVKSYLKKFKGYKAPEK